MIVDPQGKVVWLFPVDAGKAVPCPECGVSYKSNSTGPANNPLATRLLHRLWSEKYLGGYPAHCHDLGCLLCPAGWVVAATLNGKTYICKNRQQVDRMYLRLMLLQIGSRTEPSFKRDYLRGLAHRNYLAVRALGDSSFTHKH